MINFANTRVCILSENSNGGNPHIYYRNLGASEVTKRLEQRNIPCTTIEWFTHWDKDDLYSCIKTYLSAVEQPVIAISVPFISDDVYHILDVLIKLKSTLPNLLIIIGGNRTYDNNLKDIVDYFFIGRSMEIFEHWLDNEDLTKFSTKQSNVFLNNKINIDVEEPVLAYYRDSDFLTPRDVVGFELGLGCRFNCAFCNFDLRKLRNPKMSDPILIADTLNNLNSKYGLETFYITDDTINESLEKMEVLAEVVSRLKFKPNLAGFCRLDLLENPEQQKLWKKINLAAVFFGIESFNPEASRIVRKSSRVVSQIETLKKLRELTPNTFLSAGMIIGLTGDSKEHILQSMKYVADNNLLDAMQYSELGIPDMDTDVFDDYMLSDISKNPEKFGYEIVGRESSSKSGQSSQALKKWKNEWCDSDAATDIFYEIQSYLKKYKIGYSDGFEYISFLSLGLLDSTSKEVIKSINNLVVSKAAHSANNYRKEYIEKKKKWFIST